MRARPFVLPLMGVAAVLAGVLLFGDLNGNLVYYLTPSEAVAREAQLDAGERFRLAGRVSPGSVVESAAGVRFAVADAAAQVTVAYGGVPPQLFQPGIDVVVEGAFDDGRFVSDTMLIKHDEEYYPPGQAPEAAG